MKFFSRDDRDSDLNAELQSHLNMDEQNRVTRGASPEQASIESRREFGNSALVRETTRDMWGWARLERLTQDVRYALRVFANTPVVTAVALLSLALGIGANTAIFGLTNALTLRLLPVHNPQELRIVGMLSPKSDGEPNPIFTNPIWEQVRDQQDVFDGVFAWSGQNFDLAQGGESQIASGVYVSGSYFSVLGVRPAAGRLISSSDDTRGCAGVAVLSYEFWQEHFGGDPSAIGKSILLNRHPFEIVGVSSNGFSGTEVGSKYQVAVPICTEAIFDPSWPMLDVRGAWWLQVMGRQKQSLTLQQANARLRVISPAVFDATTPQNWPPEMQKRYRDRWIVSNQASSGVSDVRRQYEKPLQLLMIVVGLVLLIACANIASLMLARASARRKEIAVRLAVGASRSRLIRQLLTECILLSLAGAALGLLFARWGEMLLVRFISTRRDQVFLNLSLDWRVLAFTSAVAIVTGVLFGILPAFRSTRVSLASAMKGGQSEDSDLRARFRSGRWIVATQIALSLVLLVGAGLFLRTFTNLIGQDAGFDARNVLIANVNMSSANIPAAAQPAVNDQILDHIRAIPGVISASHSILTPISGSGWNNDLVIDDAGAAKGDDTLTDFNFITPDYLATMHTPLIQGRNFDQHDVAGSQRVAIVNQTAERKFFHGSAVGKFFKTEDQPNKLSPPIQIVGVMKDAKYRSLRQDAPPTAFFPITQIPDHVPFTAFEIRSNLPQASLAPLVTQAFAAVNNVLPIRFESFTSQINDSLTQERLLATVSGFFGILGLLLAMVGLYGVMAYLVTRRQKEIGIRLTLGAERPTIVRLVMRDVAIVLLAGLPVGIAVAAGTSKFVEKMLFGLAPRDLTTMFAAAAILAGVAVIAGYFPARRASRVDPMVVLREE